MTSPINLVKQLGLFSELKLQEDIIENCEFLTLEKGEIIVREGQFVKVVPIVISGTIRVFQTKAEREILLYYVEPRQTCMMSLSACFFNNKSPSQAVAIESTQVLAVPATFITQWQKEYNSWNDFVIRTFRNRYDELLNTFESVAFDHIDKRVLEYLQSRASKQSNREVEISHQELANELGTTRVVISRILKQFELNGLIGLGRGSIKIL
ncbi:MAG TPA: Crp/Fnr family transcriptional regulator [Cyclobacteriaceae bacterium]|jgi:CRP/FNR family transcriptional regulator|nr:Crp/Fnr family transcriptional regulator [Cyclobacteriaceae bacterium]